MEKSPEEQQLNQDQDNQDSATEVPSKLLPHLYRNILDPEECPIRNLANKIIADTNVELIELIKEIEQTRMETAELNEKLDKMM